MTAAVVEYQTEEAKANEHLLHRCQPLSLEGVFGFNPRVPLVNLSVRRNVKELVLASANALLFYTYENHQEKIEPVIGHKLPVNMIASDGSGRFVVSSDTSYCINVWDRNSTSRAAPPVSIRTIFEPFKTGETNAVALSHDGKFVLAGGNSGQEYLLKLWAWTVGNDYPDDHIALPAPLGKIKNIHFCPESGRRNQFVVTLESAVVFGLWDSKEQRLAIQIPKRHGFQDYNDSTFVENTDRAVSVTGAGMAIVWSDDKKDKVGGCLRKQFLKYLHLKYASINVVKSCDDKIITGDDDGEIRFYDSNMKILYWFKQEDLEPIRTLSFNGIPRNQQTENSEEGVEEAVENEDTVVELAPKDVSFDAKPVIIRGFISATKSGKVYDIDIVQNKIQELFYASPSIITAFDVHPTRSELCVCDGNGRMVVYDFQEKAMKITLDVPIQRTRRGRITTLAYSPCGTFLAGGAENGYLWLIDPSTMIVSASSPLQFSNEKIRLVMFSSGSDYLICAEDDDTITMLQRDKNDWLVTGRCGTHKILDVAFLSPTRFISIGEDRHLNDYTLSESEVSRPDGLAIAERYRIEQTANPTALLVLPPDQLLITNDQLKFKIFNLKSFDIVHTFLAPFHDGPARCLRLLPGGEFFTFITDNNIYLHQLPIDGNPFKYMAIYGHPKKLKFMKTFQQQYVLSFGEGDHGVSLWKVNTSPILDNQKHAGAGLDPFCSLLPGGKTGCYVKKMLSLFFYNQISPKNGDGDTDLTIRDAIDVRDVPNYMRSIGFHLTNFEEKNLMKEIEQLGTYYLTFEEVVRLFLNHRNMTSPTSEDIYNAITFLVGPEHGTHLNLQTLYDVLASSGELMEPATTEFYCSILFPDAFREQCNTDDDEKSDDEKLPKRCIAIDQLAERLC